MDLEVREIPPQSRGMYSNRMRSYKQEMGKLETDFVSQIQSFIILANLYSDCHFFFFIASPTRLSQQLSMSSLGACAKDMQQLPLYCL